MPKCILSGQVKSTFTQEQADGRYIQMTNGATTLASSLQVSGINNIEFTEEGEESITASNVSYSNTTSGMTSGNVQNAIDELFQSVSGGLRVVAQGTVTTSSEGDGTTIYLANAKIAFVQQWDESGTPCSVILFPNGEIVAPWSPDEGGRLTNVGLWDDELYIDPDPAARRVSYLVLG